MKINKLINIIILCLTFFFVFTSTVYSQKMTRVSGKVVDAITNEPLPFVNIAFVGKSIGTVTDYNGEYNIETQWASNKFQASFIGYTSQVQQVAIGKNQVINIQLKPENIELNEIIVKSKKKRYRNKDNPAVELIKKVIENKDINRKEKLDYYEYDRYEKVEFDLNNITEKFRKKKPLINFSLFLIMLIHQK